ncbi:MAG: beta-aspartyl-peptidase [Firmicutes bacterium]|nr:beta-aspartyl-peptidase [Bacillota bacterium]
MHLELGQIFIKDVQLGKKTQVKEGILFIDKDELLAKLQDERLAFIDLKLAKPGEATRIIPVKDAIEPRVKVEGPGGLFPGFVHTVDTVGSGRTHVLKGACVLTVGQVVGFQEGLIDMSGPGAKYTPFSKTQNIVLVAEPVKGLERHSHEEALRLLGLKAAAYLGAAGRNVKPDKTISYNCPPLPQALQQYPELPKVAYVYMLQSQGLLHDTYLYGLDVKKILPTLIYPTEVMDGAIVSGNCVSACDKNTTYHHLNNPIIYDLLDRHGRDFNFIGVVVTNENVTLTDKERSSNYTAKLVEWLGAEGVVISEEGFGNPDTDLIMSCTKLEKKGIKTVCLTDEYAGRDGASQSLADSSPLVNALVTAGNANEIIMLPPMEKIIGDGSAGVVDVVAGGFAGSLRADGSIRAEIQMIIGATNELGFNKISARML